MNYRMESAILYFIVSSKFFTRPGVQQCQAQGLVFSPRFGQANNHGPKLRYLYEHDTKQPLVFKRAEWMFIF